jgi:hypothetical protein
MEKTGVQPMPPLEDAVQEYLDARVKYLAR